MKQLTLATFIVCISLLFLAAKEAPTEKPYGCYKDLRWGMTPEEAKKSLGIQEWKKWEKDNVIDLTATGAFAVGDMKLDLSLEFIDGKLDRVGMDFPKEKEPISCGRDTRRRVEAYNILKPPLVKKFGEPEDKSVDKSQSVDIVEAICKKQAKLRSDWTTDESKIMLLVEPILFNGDSPIFGSVLVYYRKKETPPPPEL